MFVPKSHGVPEFMDNNTKLVTIFADRNGLGTIAAFANKRTTTGKNRKKIPIEKFLVVAKLPTVGNRLSFYCFESQLLSGERGRRA